MAEFVHFGGGFDEEVEDGAEGYCCCVAACEDLCEEGVSILTASLSPFDQLFAAKLNGC